MKKLAIICNRPGSFFAMIVALMVLFVAVACKEKNSAPRISSYSLSDTIVAKFGYNRSFYPSCSIKVIATTNEIFCEIHPKSNKPYKGIFVVAEKIKADSQSSAQFRKDIDRIHKLRETNEHGGGLDGMTSYLYVCTPRGCDSIWKWCPDKNKDPKEFAAAMLGANLAFKLSREIANKRYFWGVMVNLDENLYHSIPEPRP